MRGVRAAARGYPRNHGVGSYGARDDRARSDEGVFSDMGTREDDGA
jgi:hypothetical protein